MDHRPMVTLPICLPSLVRRGCETLKTAISGVLVPIRSRFATSRDKAGLVLLFSLGIRLFDGTPAHARFEYVTVGDGRPLIIFVHGLGGDAVKSFQAKDAAMSWPELMREDRDRLRGARALGDYATATLSYPATCSDRLSIPQAAATLVRSLYDDDVWSRHPSIVFVGHSLGGLLVQEILTTSQGHPRYAGLVERTTGAIFLATPVGGSDFANVLTRLLDHVPGFNRTCPLVRNLASIVSNAYLQRLDADWRRFIQLEQHVKGHRQRLRSICLYETKPLYGSIIVDLTASATVCDERLAMHEDHHSIAKPASRGSEVYKRLRGLIADISEPVKQQVVSLPAPLPGRRRLSAGWRLERQGDHRRPRVKKRRSTWPTSTEFDALFYGH